MGKNKRVEEKINKARYAYYTQFDLSALNRAEYRRFVKEVRTLKEFDGASGSEDKIVFFKYAVHVPKTEEEVELCKIMNERDGKKLFGFMYKSINQLTDYKVEYESTNS